MQLTNRRTGFRRRAVLIAIVTAVVTGIMALFGVQLVQRISNVEELWTVYNQDAVKADRLLKNISKQLGYGGYIHNFKNYVLRRDLEYVGTLVKSQEAVYRDLDLLEDFVITKEEKDALTNIRNVFDQYVEAVEVAQDAFNSGLSIEEVDELIRINDGPAITSFAFLNHSLLTRTRLAEREINKATEATSSMGWVLLAVVPIVVVLGVILILFLRRVMDANANLAEVRDELAMLLRQAPDAILHVGGEGDILRANDRAVTLFGYSREELLKKSVEDLIPGRFRKQHVGTRKIAFDKMAQRPIGKGSVMLAKTFNGDEIPVDISLNFSMSGGNRIATVIMRDVTERNRAEEALRQARDELELRVRERTQELVKRTSELEAEISERKRAETQLVQSSKMATIGQMASGITHELNQPMNIMRMGVEAAQIQIQRGLADIPMLSETLERVEGQILRMSDIINHMRVYTRQDRDDHTVFNPATALIEGCKLFEGQLKGLDIELSDALSSPVSDSSENMVLGHPTRLEQVVLNLLSNARDAITDRREQIGLDFKGVIWVRHYFDIANGHMVIQVEDNGGGISEKVLPHIFAPFVTTKDSGKGTGLGLSISYTIIEGMGGTIEVKNGVSGACFEVLLPLASEEDISHAKKIEMPISAPSQKPIPTPLVPVHDNSPKVLIVDDETTAAHSLSDFLQDAGYLVYTAYNGKEALQIYESDPVDAVITDLRMPIMGGIELIKELRKISNRLPIFAMTGHAPTERDALINDLGAIEVWSKPISLGEVIQHLQSVCSSDAKETKPQTKP